MTKYRFRSKKPERTCSKSFTHYRSYRKYLALDFNGRCGYCNDKEQLITYSNSYHIDHHIPNKRFRHKYDVNAYSNLVYSCPYCNLAKSDYWASDDPSISVVKNEGVIDPCDPQYDKLFIRNKHGKIIPQNQLGDFMHKKLKLYLKRHEVLYKLEKLETIISEFDNLYKQNKLPENNKDSYIALMSHLLEYSKYLNLGISSSS